MEGMTHIGTHKFLPFSLLHIGEECEVWEGILVKAKFISLVSEIVLRCFDVGRSRNNLVHVQLTTLISTRQIT